MLGQAGGRKCCKGADDVTNLFGEAAW